MAVLPLAAQASVGKIEKVGVASKVGAGTSVKVTRAGAAVRLKEGDSLEVGDELATDANTAVDIRLEDDSLIRVGVNSSYRVQEDSKLHTLMHRLLSGVVRVLVKPTDRDHTDPRIKFRMETPEGTIGVRGTEFVVIHSAGKTQLKGLDGEVLFGPAGSDLTNPATTVMVGRGFESDIASGAASPSKVQKFDLKSYLSTLNNSGPLSSRTAGSANRYARSAPVPQAAASAAPAVAASSVPMASAPRAKAKPSVTSSNNPNWQTLLMDAAFHGDVSSAKKAIQNKADVNGSLDGKTVLQAALVSGAGQEKVDDMVAYLIAQKADVNARDSDGNTPLMTVASEALDVELAEGLISACADLGATNNAGQTAADLAKASGASEIATYLKSKQAAADAASCKR